MGILRRTGGGADDISSPTSSLERAGEKDVNAAHVESAADPSSKWKVSKAGDGDVAMALFGSPDEIHEPIDPEEERKLVRKIVRESDGWKTKCVDCYDIR